MHRRTDHTLIFLALLVLFLGQLLGGILSREEATPAAEPMPEAGIFTGTVAIEATPVTAPGEGFWTRTAPEGKVSKGAALFVGPLSTREAAASLQCLSEAVEARTLAKPRRKEALHQAIAQAQSEKAGVLRVMGLVLEEIREEDLLQAQNCMGIISAQNRTQAAPVGGIFLAGGTYPVLGQIVTSETWRLSLVLPFGVELGQKLSLRLLSGIFQNVSCRVESAQWQEEGCQVVVSCGEKLEEVAKIRKLTVKILSE